MWTNSVAVCDQIRAIDKSRILKKIGELTTSEIVGRYYIRMAAILKGILDVSGGWEGVNRIEVIIY
jgi:hypothetical protein